MSGYDWMMGKKQQTIGEKIKSFFRNDNVDLDKKAIIALYRVKSSINRIQTYVDKLREKEREYFNEVVDSKLHHDERRAKIYARQVADIRKVIRQLYQVEYMLQHVALKLETFTIFHGATAEVKPVLALMRHAVGLLRESAPYDLWVELQATMKELETMMDTSIVDISSSVDVALDAEAKKVLEEAKLVAEQKLKEKYSEIPSLINLGEEEKTGESST